MDERVGTDPGGRRVAALIELGREREAAVLATVAPAVAAGHAGATNEGGTMDVGQQLGELGPLLTGVVGNIDESQLDNATPCTDFKVRDVLEHMIGGATMFTAAFKGDPASAPEPDLSDPINGFPPVLGGLAESILAPGALDQTVESPFGPLPGDVFARVVVLDGLVHGWDMATATGQRYEPSDELVAAAHGFAEQVLPMTAGSGAFADPVEPPADASPIERLAALTGRTV